VLGRSVADIDTDAVGDLAMGVIEDIPADLQGSSAYRARVGASMVSRALTKALSSASTEA
jgi:carbon-monoxide dehydrogenase medium subunit